jgi:hypothetical protein
MLFASSAQAAVGWANIQWPTLGSVQPSNSDITVYSQVWKDGCTDPAGACTDLVATLYYKAECESIYTSVPMGYFGDVANNDEYMGTIPQASLCGYEVNFYIEYYDLEDDSYYYADGFDLAMPAWYDITHATQVAFSMAFYLDMSCVDPITVPGVSGTFNNWGVTLMYPSGNDMWITNVLIPEGSNPVQEFKFVNGNDYESLSENRTFTIVEGNSCGYYAGYWDDFDCTSVDAEEMPVSFTLEQNHPNPFNPSTAISFSLEETGMANLSVFDLQGREVAQLVSGLTEAGSHTVSFDASNLASGIYFYSLNTDAGMLSKRMVLVK